MMDTNKIEKIIHSTFSNISRNESESLIRCERHHERRPLSVYYFDLSSALRDSNFDLKRFQEEVLVTDYYQHRGALQWNYYLVFLVSAAEYSTLLASPLAKYILQDTSYARKYIISEIDLEIFVKQAISVAPPAVARVDDLVSRWKRKLDEEDLSDIYTTSPRTRVLERIKAGVATPSVAEEETATVRNSPFLSELVELQTESYRHMPDHTYPLKKMNLLAGPNGSGKTSFLEAIELCVCGATKSNGEETGARIILKTEDGIERTHAGSIPLREHKSLAQQLYGVSAGRGENPMPDAFGRFNFFSTDAAYELVFKHDNASAIKKAFVRLALGDEADRVNRRLDEFSADLQKTCSRLSSGIDNAEALSSQLNAEIQALQAELLEKGETAHNVAGAIIKKLKLTDAPDVSDVKLRDRLRTIEAKTGRITEAVDWMSNLTFNDLVAQNKILACAGEVAKKAQDKNILLNDKLSGLHKEVPRLDEEIHILRVCSEIHAVNNIQMLPMLRHGYRELRDQVTQLEGARALLANLREIHAEIGDAIELDDSLTRSVEDNRQLLDNIEQKIRSSEAVLGDASRLLATMKAAGAEYLDLTQKEESCPLCGAVHPPGRLRTILKEEVAAQDDSLLKLRVEARSIENKVKQAQRLLEAHSLGEKIAKALQTDPFHGKHLSEFISWLEGRIALAGHLSEQSNQLQKLESDIDSIGIELSEAMRVDARLGEAFNLSLHSVAASELERVLISREDVQRRALAEQEKSKSEVEQVRQDLHHALSAALPGLYETEHMLTVLSDRIHSIEDAIRTVNEIREDLPLEDTTELRTFHADLGAAIRELENAITFRSKIEHSSLFLKEKRKAAEDNDQLLKVQKKELARFSRVRTILAELQQSHGMEEHLRDFVAAYKNTILDIFKRIHAPREFKDILLGTDTIDEILLVRDNGEEAKLSQISTGQRSALALAIFLALNASVKERLGLIIIDDPIAHIDDLNNLSFIDYLRNAALDGAQVFIATANTKLRKLIEMKFSFLMEHQFQVLEFFDDRLID